LRPVLAGWPIDPWPASDPDEIAGSSWRLAGALRGVQLSGQGRPVSLPEEVAWEPDPGPAYKRWPGLAPDPDEVPRLALAGLLAEPRGLGEPYLVLARAARSADIPAVMAGTLTSRVYSYRPCCAAGKTGSARGSSPSTARGSMCRWPGLHRPQNMRRMSRWSTFSQAPITSTKARLHSPTTPLRSSEPGSGHSRGTNLAIFGAKLVPPAPPLGPTARSSRRVPSASWHWRARNRLRYLESESGCLRCKPDFRRS